jgi:bifunctional non-homologous end joining protein LigD
MTPKSIVLHNQRNGSDKVYALSLEQVDGGWVVNYRNGRRVRGSGYKIRGNAGGRHTRTPKPYDAALRIFQRLTREKLSQHYVVVEQTQDGAVETDDNDSKDSGREPMFPLSIMEEAKARQLCDNPSYCAQEEENGERRMLLKEVNGEVRGIDGQGEYATLPSPIRNTPALLRAESFLVDSELIGQTLRVWDLLEQDGEDLRDQPMQIRYEKLCSLIPNYYSLAVQVVPTAFTRTVKHNMLDATKARNGEGILFKLVGAPYVEGTSKYALKHTFRSAAVVQVVGASRANRTIQMGMLSDEGIQFVGNLPLSSVDELPALGTLVLVEYLSADPESGSLVEARYVGISADKVEADRYDSLKRGRRVDGSTENIASAA